MTNYGLWASCKLVRDAADALFQSVEFESKHPDQTPDADTIRQVVADYKAVELALRVLDDYLPPFDA